MCMELISTLPSAICSFTFVLLGWGSATTPRSFLALPRMRRGFDVEDANVIVALCKGCRQEIWNVSDTSQWAGSRAEVWGTML